MTDLVHQGEVGRAHRHQLEQEVAENGGVEATVEGSTDSSTEQEPEAVEGEDTGVSDPELQTAGLVDGAEGGDDGLEDVRADDRDDSDDDQEESGEDADRNDADDELGAAEAVAGTAGLGGLGALASIEADEKTFWYTLAALLGLLVVWYLFVRSGSEDGEDSAQPDGEEQDSGGFIPDNWEA